MQNNHISTQFCFRITKYFNLCVQRIALVYFVVALIETFTTKLRPTTLTPRRIAIFTAYKWQW
jgi:hypothetical protein